MHAKLWHLYSRGNEITAVSKQGLGDIKIVRMTRVLVVVVETVQIEY